MASTTTEKLSFLDLVDICDNVHVHHPSPRRTESDAERLVPLFLTQSPTSPAIGLLRPAIVEQLLLENKCSQENNEQTMWMISLEEPARVNFQPWLDAPSKRTAAMKKLCERWRDTGLFPDVCGPKKWRAEMYPVYADPFGVHDSPDDTVNERLLNYAFEMERSACALFGVVTYGVHMSIYEEVEKEGTKDLRVWIPTRARTKQTWPGFLDNSVAGGIPSGMPIFESLVKECMEEASIADHIVRKHVRAVGAVSYFHRSPKGWLQPEVEYVYDLRIPSGMDTAPFEPKPLDGEVESFELMYRDQIIENMSKGRFKPNCALVLIDLFIRLGHVTPDNEPNFMKINTRLHGRFDYDKW